MTSHLTRRQFVSATAATTVAALALPRWSTAEGVPGARSLENLYFKYIVGSDARNLGFIDKRSGHNYCRLDGTAPLARVKKAGRFYDASSARFEDARLSLAFGDSGFESTIQVCVHPQHIVFEVLSVDGSEVDELIFVDIPLSLSGSAHEPFAACALALNLRTNVHEMPRPSSRLSATTYARFGMTGAKAAIVAAPPERLRAALQETVAAADELPHSPLGGPWAIGPAINRGSYLFNFTGITLENSERWIKLAQTLGMNQIDFHCGTSFRFGDYRPNPQMYPNGLNSVKAVVDKLHEANIAAGLHTYAFFIDKACPWVTPVPDRRLAKDHTFTLASEIDERAAKVHVTDSTAGLSATTGFFVRNGLTLRIDDELITYSAIAKEAPFGFAGCKRGAHGTRRAVHRRGAEVHHLKECFGLFVPDPQTPLFDEIAACTAATFNACGFDMLYLDALDGEDVLGGVDEGWHHGSRFVYALWKQLKRPALIEMSTFHHHLWCVRSRFNAWDAPSRGYKKFVDRHCASNEENASLGLPAQLGWWALNTGNGAQSERCFADDVEYLMAKCLGADTGFALMGVDPDRIEAVPELARAAATIRRYEELRHSGQVPETIRARLRVRNREFRLIGSLREGWHFRRAQYDKHKVESAESWSSHWKMKNEFAAQPLRFRIEALMAAGSYDSPENRVLADWTRPSELTRQTTASTVKLVVELMSGKSERGGAIARLTATNHADVRARSWANVEKHFTPPQNLGARVALGVWVHGDGEGGVVNLQVRSPNNVSSGIADHYAQVNFKGWRYLELIEPESNRYGDYEWPYGDSYSIYRDSVDFTSVETLGVWCNDLPPGRSVTYLISPIKAISLVSNTLTNPTISIGGQSITLFTSIPSGHYVEMLSSTDCKLYGPNGELVREIAPGGAVPLIRAGDNEIRFQAQATPGLKPRANVTLMLEGDSLERNRR